MILALAWIAGALAVGFAAGSRGRSGIGWCVLALLLSPILAVLLLLCFPTNGRVAAPRSAQVGAADMIYRVSWRVALAFVFGILCLLSAGYSVFGERDLETALFLAAVGLGLLFYANRRGNQEKAAAEVFGRSVLGNR